MKKIEFSTFKEEFKYPFNKANFRQWLAANHSKFNWFFHRHDDALLGVLQNELGDVAAVKIFKSGSVVCSGANTQLVDRSMAFFHLLLNDELPHPWEIKVDVDAVRNVVGSFIDGHKIEFIGVVLDVETELSSGMRRLFHIEAERVKTDYHVVDEYLYERFVSHGDEPYPTLILETDIHERFHEFFENVLGSRAYWNQTQLGHSFLLFSDQTLVSLKDIYFHPYSALIGPEFFEELSFDVSELDFSPFEFLGVYGDRYENNFLKNVLAHSLDDQKRVYLAENLFEDISSILEVRSFENLGKSEWKLIQGDRDLYLEVTPFDDFNDCVYIGNASYYHRPSKTLFRSSYKEEMNFWRNRGLKGDLKLKFPEDIDWGSFHYWLDLFNDKYHQSLEIECEWVEPDKLGINIELADQNESVIEFSLNFDDERIVLHQVELKYIISALESGLGSFFYEDNSELAPQAKGSKRQNVLKLLRHAGFFHLLFHEAIRAKEEELADTKLKRSIRELAVAAVLKTTKDADLIWKDEFGTKASKIINDFLSLFIDGKERIYTFKAHGSLYDTNITPIFEKVFVYISDLLKNTLDEKVLTKQRFKEFKQAKNRAGFYLENALEGVLLTTVPAGAKVYLNGKALDSLNAEDIESIFKINETGEAIDWFELHPEVFLKGKRVNKSEDIVFHGKGCIEHKGQYYLIPQTTLPKVKWLDYFWKKLTSAGAKKSNSWDAKIEQIPKSQTLELLAMHEAGIPVQGGERWEKILFEYQKLKNRDKVSFEFDTEDYSVPLKQFQKSGTQWMIDLYRLGLGGILADDMGLGKTIQSIGALEWLRFNNEMGHCLVVVPTSLTYNWVSEVEKFAPNIPVFNYSSQTRDKHEKFLAKNKNSLTVITYGLFNRNCKNLENDATWNITLFDEAQNLKNITATRTGYARKFPCNVKFCLTGTPMENHYGEFYSLVDIAVPGALGSYSDFMKAFNFKASKGVNFKNMEQDLEYLKLKTAPLVMRRTKEKILKELPDKTETSIKLDFEAKQEKIYRDIAIAYNEKIKEVVYLKGDNKSQLEILSAILRLRQACSYPQALPEVKYDKEPPKFKALFGQLSQIAEEGHKSLVFTNFKTTLLAIEEGLEEQGQKVFIITGATPKKKREKILKDYEEYEGAAVLGMTLKTGGVGLNLTCANYVFHVEPWWNPAAESQATDRAHRMGQKNKVQVYRYIMRESIEEKIETLKQRKTLAIEGLFSEEAFNIKKAAFAKTGLSYEDFEYLVGR